MSPIVCEHQWAETQRFYAPPQQRLEIRNATDAIAQRLLFGVTTLVQKCTICGTIETYEILGRPDGEK